MITQEELRKNYELSNWFKEHKEEFEKERLMFERAKYLRICRDLEIPLDGILTPETTSKDLIYHIRKTLRERFKDFK